MSDVYDIWFEEAPDAAGRAPFFDDGRVKTLVDLIDDKTLEYTAEVIFKFSSKNLFNKAFDDFEADNYIQNGMDEIYPLGACFRSIYSEQYDLTIGNLRSAILERLVFNYKLPSYKVNAWIAAFVYLKNSTTQSSRSIDVAAWSQLRKRGECVECAVSDKFVTQESKKQEIREMQIIVKSISDKLNTYFVSFQLTEALKLSVGKFSNIDLVGRDKLLSFLRL